MAFSLDAGNKEVEWSSGGCEEERVARFRKGMGTEVDGGMMPVIVGRPRQPGTMWKGKGFGFETWGFGMQAVTGGG